LGVFTYSQQDGTRAAKMESQTPDSQKKRRQKKAMAEQLKIAREISASRVGSEAMVLAERAANARDLESASVSSWEHGLIRASRDLPAGGAGAYWLARGEADAPDIDGRVYVRGTVSAGEFVRVKVIGHTDYDLIAEPA
jgi:ribosomal protein S12 methylthiotransferase